MGPLTIVLSLAGLAVGFGANMAVTKKRIGTATDQANKELEKAKREGSKIINDARNEAGRINEETRKE